MIVILGGYMLFMTSTFLDISRGAENPLVMQAISLLVIALGICLGYIDIRESNNRVLIMIRIMIGAIFLGIVWWQMDDTKLVGESMKRRIAARVLLLVAMSFLLYFKRLYHINSIRIKPRPLMYAGMGVYALFSSAIMSCLIVGSYPYIPFDCAQLQDYSVSLVTSFTNPMAQGFEKAQTSVSSVTDFLSQDIGDLVFGEVYTGTVVVTGSLSDDPSRKMIHWIEDQDKDDEVYIGSGVLLVDADDELNTGIIGYIDNIKKDIVGQLLADQELVNSSICESVLDILIQRWNEGGLKLSVVLIMFALFSPFMGFSMLLVTVVAFLVFVLGKSLRIRRTHRVLMEVEDIV